MLETCMKTMQNRLRDVTTNKILITLRRDLVVDDAKSGIG